MKRVEIKTLLESKDKDEVLVKGWVRTKRGSKNVSFIHLNDGSTIHNIQIVADNSQIDEKITTGASISVMGQLVESPGGGQSVEIKAKSIKILGIADDSYPLQPKKHSLDFLRKKAHLRFRTSTFSAISRVRHTLSYAIHQYFHERGFFHLATPIITASDAEGAGDVFRVTTDSKKSFFGKDVNLTVSGQLLYLFNPAITIYNSCALVPIGFKSKVLAKSVLLVPIKLGRDFIISTTPFCQAPENLLLVPKSANFTLISERALYLIKFLLVPISINLL